MGKIFKPALRLDATRRCARNAIAQLDGSRAVDVVVRDAGGAIAVVLKLADPAMPRAVDQATPRAERITFRVEVESAPQ